MKSKLKLYTQNIGVLYRLTIGFQHPLVARLTNDCLYLGFFMFLATICFITIFRILLVIKVKRQWSCSRYIFVNFQPAKFWNADHERVYKMLLVVMLIFSVAAIALVEIYLEVYYEGSMIIQIKQGCSLLNRWQRNDIYKPIME